MLSSNLPLLSWAIAAAWLRCDGVATETAAWDGVTDGALDLYRMDLRSNTAVRQGMLQGMGGPGDMVNVLNLQYRPFELEEL